MKAILSSMGLAEFPNLLDLLVIVWRVALVILLTWALWQMCKRMFAHLRERATERGAGIEELKRIDTITQVSRYGVGVVIVVVTVMLVLAEVGISIAPLLATASIAGIAIGFGVQSLVKDYFTGFALLLENQIRAGDAVEVAGKSGSVEAVTLRYVRLRDFDGVVHFIPNGLITTVSNHSMEYVNAVVSINIDHGNDIEAACEALREAGAALRANPDFAYAVIGDLDIAGVEQMSDTGMLVRARFKVTPPMRIAVRRELIKCAKAAFAAHGIKLPGGPTVLIGGKDGDRPLRVVMTNNRDEG